MRGSIPRIGALIAVLAGASVPASATTITFNGFIEGLPAHDQYMFEGMRITPDHRGGPFYDDAALFGFLLDSPPNVLNFNPLTAGSGPGRIHASVGTYEFHFVDPSNPFVPSFTDQVSVVVTVPDVGDTILTAYGASGEMLARSILHVDVFSFASFPLSVIAPGIQRATVTTPLESPTIGAVLDTVIFAPPAEIPSREIAIDIKPGSMRNAIRLGARSNVQVAILSDAALDPRELDPAMVLFQRARAVAFTFLDRNRDRVPDLILTFRTSDLVGITSQSTHATLTAVAADGTPLAGSDEIVVQSGGPRDGGPAGTATAGSPRIVLRPNG
ncbi:MAG TPA: hypothetical protein VJV23_04910 [Candidatus Polarisedimenticolia bacterium]|nr:hypothetical protein [Candidatus Polarisedimenticolia bacterium]